TLQSAVTIGEAWPEQVVGDSTLCGADIARPIRQRAYGLAGLTAPVKEIHRSEGELVETMVPPLPTVSLEAARKLKAIPRLMQVLYAAGFTKDDLSAIRACGKANLMVLAVLKHLSSSQSPLHLAAYAESVLVAPTASTVKQEWQSESVPRTPAMLSFVNAVQFTISALVDMDTMLGSPLDGFNKIGNLFNGTAFFYTLARYVSPSVSLFNGTAFFYTLARYEKGRGRLQSYYVEEKEGKSAAPAAPAMSGFSAVTSKAEARHAQFRIFARHAQFGAQAKGVLTTLRTALGDDLDSAFIQREETEEEEKSSTSKASSHKVTRWESAKATQEE
ncbi:hypothetical protein KIPB_008790, partial [Kipferlia bialata]